MAKENLKELERYINILIEQGFDDDEFLATDAPVLERALSVSVLKPKVDEFFKKHSSEIEKLYGDLELFANCLPDRFQSLKKYLSREMEQKQTA